ncbi:alpha/beta hydrolase [Mesobacillus harenae]|uniref:alpha/beta hydrolase n=1 Tax=Mesobacillus harenae TaxID=2213203 RepID=UPI001580EC28|nr:alpha/beta fold hydrolase [Mesobacillus harenae]
MIGCLCIHGFTGSPLEVEPLVEFLKEKTEWIFEVPTLPGHGEPLSLDGIEYRQWIEHAEAKLHNLFEICDQVYIIGFSMGGLIASYLSARYPVKKLVLLSAAAYYVNPKQLAADIVIMMKDSFKGNLLENELFTRYKRKIQQTPFKATIQFRKLVSNIRPILKEVTIPTLIVQGESDGIVPPRSAKYLYNTLGSAQKKLIFLKNAKHVICHSEEKEQLFREVYDFLLDPA